MKKLFCTRNLLLVLCCAGLMLSLVSCASKPTSQVTKTAPYTVRGQKYYPLKTAEGFVEEGIASWYGPGFHGKLTANGETYNQNAMTAAHKLLPLGTRVKVTNLENGKSVVLNVNDRGPFLHDRVIDVSKRAAQRLDMYDQGTARVRIVAIGSYYDNSKFKVTPATAAATAAAVGAAVSKSKSKSSSSSSGGASSAAALKQAKESRVLNEQGEIPDELKYLFEDEGTAPVASSAPTSAEEVVEQVVEHVAAQHVGEVAATAVAAEYAGVTGDFYVQLGEFTVKKFASLLAVKLKDAGYPARSYQDSGVWRVRIGPWSTAAKANEFLPKFTSDFPSASIVLAE